MKIWFMKYDAAVGDITILANRSSFVDFSLPFTEAGIAMIVPVRDDSVDHGWFFIKPLSLNLWITSFSFFVFLGFVVWILEHQNSSEDFRRGPILHQIATSLWFSFSIMVFAQGEKLTSNLSRMVVVIWFFVVFVLAQSYTASLTSWLTVQQLQPATDINQIIKNNWSVGYQNGSFIYGSLKILGIQHLKPYDTLEQLNELLTKGGRNGGVDSVIDEIPYMKLFLAIYGGKDNYNYTMAVFHYSTGGFGFVFPPGSALRNDISTALLNLTQNSKEINEIDERWFGKIDKLNSSHDSNINAFSSRIDLSYFKSLFIITASAAILALTLYLFRYSFDSTTIWTRIIDAVTYQINVMKDKCKINNVKPPVAAIEEEEEEEASPSTE